MFTGWINFENEYFIAETKNKICLWEKDERDRVSTPWMAYTIVKQKKSVVVL